MSIEANTLTETLSLMRQKLARLVPDFELQYKAELVYEINRLKRERNAIILGHNYMEPALYATVPDVVGDSLELSRIAANTDKDPIVFCGVRFMAETAKILSPQKTVLLPALRAGCSLAESISAEDVRRLRAEYPGVPIVAYINTYAEVKAEVDVCCTSGNAVKVANSFKEETIIFLPDEFLASNVARETNKRIIFPKFSRAANKTEAPDTRPVIIGWHGRCEVHEKFSVDDIKNVRQQFPDVFVLAHPECSPEVIAASDFSGSTSAMLKVMKDSSAKQHLILTECSMADNIIADNPDKEVLRLCSIRCPHMAEITLEDTLKALRENEQQIDVPEPVRTKARRSLERMLEIR